MKNVARLAKGAVYFCLAFFVFDVYNLVVSIAHRSVFSIVLFLLFSIIMAACTTINYAAWKWTVTSAEYKHEMFETIFNEDTHDCN